MTQPNGGLGSELVNDRPHFLRQRIMTQDQRRLAGTGLALARAATMVGFAFLLGRSWLGWR